MVDIQSAAAEIRRGIKKDTKKPQGKNIMSASAIRRAAISTHRASTEHSLTLRVRTMLSYREVEASLLVGWLKFDVIFQHKYGGNIRDEGKPVTTVGVMLP